MKYLPHENYNLQLCLSKLQNLNTKNKHKLLVKYLIFIVKAAFLENCYLFFRLWI